MKTIKISLIIAFSALSIFLNAQGITNGTILPSLDVNENAFLDLSTYNNGTVSEGKGLIFPRTDLTLFTFYTVNINGIDFPSSFDGMIVYNVGTGLTTADPYEGGLQVTVVPGYYYFYNPVAEGSGDGVNNGQWIPLKTSPVTLPQGATGQTLRHDGTDWVGNNNLYNDGTNIGIGEQSPAGKLHVSAPGAWSGIVFTGTGLNDLTVDKSGYAGSGSRTFAVRIQNAGPNPNLIEISSNGGATWSSAMPIAPNINMGYGVYVNFAQTNGHTYADLWEFTVNESFFDVFIVKDETVGVGTASPQANFHAVGTVRLESLSGDNQSTAVMIDNNGDLSTRALNNVAFDGFTETDPKWNGNANTTDPIYRTGNVGLGTTSPAALLHTNGTGTGEGNVLLVGSFKSSSPGSPPVSGAGTRMMWYPDKAAFRAGHVGNENWDRDSIGPYSVAMGSHNIAKGNASVALGNNNVSSGIAAMAFGIVTKASGDYSTAMGYHSEATSAATTAIGYYAKANGPYSTALGHLSLASGNTSFAVGYNSTASAYYSSAIGTYISSPSAFEMVVGRYNTTYTPLTTTGWQSADRLFVIGNGTADGSRSNAITVLKSGNTGIGTDNPQTQLHTTGSVRFAGAGSPGTGKILTSDASGTATWQTPGTYMPSGTSGQTLRHNGTAWVANDVLYNNGSFVGIGTTSPAGKLHVGGSGINRLFVTSHLSNANAGAILELSFSRNTPAAPTAALSGDHLGSLVFGGHDATAYVWSAFIKAEASDNFSTSRRGSNLIFGTTQNGTTGVTTKMILTNEGNLGINTTSPEQKLHVDGTIRVSGSNQFGVYAQTNTGTSAGTGGYFKNASSASSTTGVYGEGIFSGTDNPAYTHGGSFRSHSTSQDGYGIFAYATKSDASSPSAFAKGGFLWGAVSGAGESYGVDARASGGGISFAVYADASGGATSNYGIYTKATGTSGTTGYGIYALSTGATTNYAGYFAGNVNVTGNFTVSGAKSFLIDHPQDPANKYLYHYNTESPEPYNLYRGTVTVGSNGEAIVKLPDYFSSINKDFSYHLTPIGAYAPLYVSREIEGNTFVIGGGVPGMKVSWQVTALRNDAWVRDNGFKTETSKPTEEQGTYIYPKGYGMPEELSREYKNKAMEEKKQKQQTLSY